MEDLQTSYMPAVTVILLNWNGWQETIIGLESLLVQGYPNYSLVLLDNGSTDDSVEQIIDRLKERGIELKSPGEKNRVGPSCILLAEGNNFALLKNAANEGFTGGNNMAIQYALAYQHPDYIFLLNNDAILEKDCLFNCVTLARKTGAAIIGALVKSIDRTTVTFSGANPWRELFYLSAARPEAELPDEWETGRVEASGELVDSAFLREHHAKRGYYLDPKFFIYCEETDLAMSAQALGKKIMMTKRAIIYHGLAVSMGGAGNPMQYYYITRNRIFLAQRWLPTGKRIFFHCYYLLTRVFRIVQKYLQGKTSVSTAIWEGLCDGYTGRSGKWNRHRSRR